MNSSYFSLLQGNSAEVSQNCLTINLQLHIFCISSSHSKVFKCLILLAYACLQSTAVTLNNMKYCKKILKMLLVVQLW